MNPEQKVCQNCKQNFVIEPEDFDFYKKIDVPPPTWCPDCRMMRRFMFRNERSLSKRQCDLCKKDIISMYPAGTDFPVYCVPCWYSDNWNGQDFARDYDFSRPFFDQLRDLWKVAPRQAVMQIKSTGSEYANGLLESKNVYLGTSVVRSENVMYSSNIDESYFVMDSLESANLQQCYEVIKVGNSSRLRFSILSSHCIDSWFLYDCVNCKNCILSSNLQNKQYYIRNKKYSKEEYEKMLSEMDLGSYASLQKYKKEFEQTVLRNALHRYADVMRSQNATGNDLWEAKNARRCFYCYSTENIAYCYRTLLNKDCFDTCFNSSSELMYEYINGGKGNSRNLFSAHCLESIRDVEYCYFCTASSNLFGCAGIRSGEYCILNKQYPKEEYQELRRKIIQHMNDMPHTDSKGRVWKYGEYFPLEFAHPFGYNETLARDFYPITKEKALEMGYFWKDMETRSHAFTKPAGDLPDHIKDADDSILKETVSCAHAGTCDHLCSSAFRIIADELNMYRDLGLPLPRLCPNCRHYERLAYLEPLQLWDGKCQCAGTGSENGTWKNFVAHIHGEEHCPNTFQTPYAPGRPEILYCEKCYQEEVA